MVMRKVEPPAGMHTAIHALLKPRWELEAKSRRFVAPRQEFVIGDRLPPGTEVDYLVSRLRKVARESLSPEEKKLSRWVQIILPLGTKGEEYVTGLQSWPCFAEVHVAPEPSLPSPGGVYRPS